MWECGKGHFWSSSFIGWQSGEDAVIVGVGGGGGGVCAFLRGLDLKRGNGQ